MIAAIAYGVRRFCALAPRWWRRSGALGVAVMVAAAPATWFVVTFVAGNSRTPGTASQTTIAFITVVFCIVGAIVTGLTGVVWVAARNCGVRVPIVMSVLLVLAQIAAMLLLDWLVPFRPGLLSVLLYSVPALLIADGVVSSRRQAWIACAVAVAGVFALAVPLRLLQQAVGAWEWTHLDGVPSRAWLQVINLHGMRQEPYQWDARTRMLTANFDESPNGTYGGPAEMVIPGQSVPPTKWNWSEMDLDTTRCTQQRSGLWECVNPSSLVPNHGPVTYVLRSGPVTIILAGALWENGLAEAISSAHPASDAELWSRAGLAPRTAVGWLLL